MLRIGGVRYIELRFVDVLLVDESDCICPPGAPPPNDGFRMIEVAVDVSLADVRMMTVSPVLIALILADEPLSVTVVLLVIAYVLDVPLVELPSPPGCVSVIVMLVLDTAVTVPKPPLFRMPWPPGPPLAF